ncbi:hypothetical protein C7974DRAFT_66966 [Boeremia exigua]|uniref:uncharacterized protein n=1 Tax=Boeremia exigua TaxID=749465 RepID=UPI001E8DC2FB|nr:uncharacterized protein C7974DRAFT_66966 [Boeremia exigua]KAH6613928.1 hypothetical protein C7974DRAFT_66966 [Boeremia exigua]
MFAPCSVHIPVSSRARRLPTNMSGFVSEPSVAPLQRNALAIQTEMDARAAARMMKSPHYRKHLFTSIPELYDMSWYMLPESFDGRALIISSHVGNGGHRILAHVTEELPHEVTYMYMKYKRDASGIEVVTSLRSIPVRAVSIYLTFGGTLIHPFDKAANSGDCAERNLSALTRWYNAGSLFNGSDEDAYHIFALELKKALASINSDGALDRRTRRSRNSKTSGPGDDFDNYLDNLESAASDSGDSTSPDQQWPSDADGDARPLGSVQDPGDDVSPTGSPDRLHSGSPCFVDNVTVNVRDQSANDRLNQPLLYRQLEEAAVSDYIFSLIRTISLVHIRKKSYKSCAICIGEDGELNYAHAFLEDKQLNPEVHVFYKLEKDENPKRSTVSVPKSVERILRPPYNQAIVENASVRKGEHFDGGDYLLLFCQFIFAVKGELPWSAFESQHNKKILDMIVHVHSREPQPDTRLPKATPSTARGRSTPFRMDDSPPPSSFGKKRVPPDFISLKSPTILGSDSAYGSSTPSVAHTYSPVGRVRARRSVHSADPSVSTVATSSASSRMANTNASNDIVHVDDQAVTAIRSTLPQQIGTPRGHKRSAENQLSDIHARAERLREAQIADRKRRRDEERARVSAELAAIDEACEADVKAIHQTPDIELVTQFQ